MPSQHQDVLAVASGTAVLSLAEAWYETGSSKLTLLDKSSRFTENEESLWEDVIRPFSFILYVSQQGDLEEFRRLQAACITERKTLLPAMFIHGVGIIGPLLQPGGHSYWESAWRRVHASVLPTVGEPQNLDSPSIDLLVNLIVHQGYRVAAGDSAAECSNQCYILNLQTLEGSWHPVLKHPLVSGFEPAHIIKDAAHQLGAESDQPEDIEEWFNYFHQLTSETTGIFHIWEEGGSQQLPLSQCFVQPVDPLSEGPAQLLPAALYSGLTHLEARREAGLAGLEAYIARMQSRLISGVSAQPDAEVYIGAGYHLSEAIGRGLRAYLTKQLSTRTLCQEPVLTRVEKLHIEDVHCQFYRRALSLLESEPLIATGESLLGLPVVWVYSGNDWYGSADLTMTYALRRSLQKALMHSGSASLSTVSWSNRAPVSLAIPSTASVVRSSDVLPAFELLKEYHTRLEIIDMRCEAFLKEGPLHVVGVMLREEESR